MSWLPLLQTKILEELCPFSTTCLTAHPALLPLLRQKSRAAPGSRGLGAHFPVALQNVQRLPGPANDQGLHSQPISGSPQATYRPAGPGEKHLLEKSGIREALFCPHLALGRHCISLGPSPTALPSSHPKPSPFTPSSRPFLTVSLALPSASDLQEDPSCSLLLSHCCSASGSLCPAPSYC